MADMGRGRNLQPIAVVYSPHLSHPTSRYCLIIGTIVLGLCKRHMLSQAKIMQQLFSPTLSTDCGILANRSLSCLSRSMLRSAQAEEQSVCTRSDLTGPGL